MWGLKHPVTRLGQAHKVTGEKHPKKARLALQGKPETFDTFDTPRPLALLATTTLLNRYVYHLFLPFVFLISEGFRGTTLVRPKVEAYLWHAQIGQRLSLIVQHIPSLDLPLHPNCEPWNIERRANPDFPSL